MTPERRRNIITGVFVLIAFAVIFAMTFVITGGFLRDTLRIRAAFDSVSGLEIGSPVLVSGVRAGRVSSIQPNDVPDEPIVLVIMDVDKRFAIRENASVRIVQQGFIGDKRLEITPGLPPSPVIAFDDATIAAVEPFDIEKTFADAQAIVTDLRTTIASVKELLLDEENQRAIRQSLQELASTLEVTSRMLKTNEQAINESIANVRQLTEESKEVIAKANSLVENADGRIASVTGNLDTTLNELRANMETLTKNVNDTLAVFSEQGTALGGRADALMARAGKSIEALAKSITETSGTLNDVLTKIDRGDGTIGLLLNDPAPFRNLSQAIEGLRNALLGQKNRFYDSRIDYQDAAPGEGAAKPR